MTDQSAPRPRGPLRLSPWRRWTLYVTAIGVWLTGVLWLIYHYFLRQQGPFGFKNNPLEEWWLIIHGGFSFAAIWIFGMLWAAHVTSGWTMRWRRWSGGTMVGVTIFLILTGYGLYYLVNENLRFWTSIAHWAVGIAALAVFLVHWLSKSAPRRK